VTTINPQAPVMVTGATGCVAGRLVEKLLQEGRAVAKSRDSARRCYHRDAA